MAQKTEFRYNQNQTFDGFCGSVGASPLSEKGAQHPAPDECLTPRVSVPVQEDVTAKNYGDFRSRAAAVVGYRVDVCLPVDGTTWKNVPYRQTSEEV